MVSGGCKITWRLHGETIPRTKPDMVGLWCTSSGHPRRVWISKAHIWVWGVTSVMILLSLLVTSSCIIVTMSSPMVFVVSTKSTSPISRHDQTGKYIPLLKRNDVTMHSLSLWPCYQNLSCNIFSDKCIYHEGDWSECDNKYKVRFSNLNYLSLAESEIKWSKKL